MTYPVVHDWVLVASDPWAQQVRVRMYCGEVFRYPWATRQMPARGQVTCPECIEQRGQDELEEEVEE